MNELIANQVIKVPTKEQQIENQRKRIKELEDGIRALLDIHLQGVDKPAKSVWERKLNVAIHRLSKLIGIEV